MLNVSIINNNAVSGSLCFSESAIMRYTKLVPKKVFISTSGDDERKNVEKFIEDIFKENYGAEIKNHYPILLSVHDENNKILGALGIRYAGNNKLFLEQYLTAKVENITSDAVGKTIPRECIAEIGNLGSAGNGASIFLFVALTAYLTQQGFSHCVFTGTKLLHNYFRKLDLEPVLLGYADPSLLPDQGASWGTYYNTSPRILAGDLKASYSRLHDILMVEHPDEACRYTAKLHQGEAI